MNLMEPRFPLGKIYATAAVASWADEENIELAKLLQCHHCGDWGDLDAGDKAANEDALSNGTRIFSGYLISNRKIYVITESDRSLTSVLFASEY